MISLERVMLSMGLDIVPSLESRISLLDGDVIVLLGKGKYVNATKDRISPKTGDYVRITPAIVLRAMSGQIMSGVFPYNKKLRCEFYDFLEKRGISTDDLRDKDRNISKDKNGYWIMPNTFNDVKERVCDLLNTRKGL